jgi:tetratricopeptide (TPR) repeat protein
VHAASSPPCGHGLVAIVREFLLARVAARRLARRFRSGELRFEEVQELVGDGPESVLFRLKGHCHALFRSPGASLGCEALFDLAVGALFHEAMKFRENFYQQSVYGPKVRALRRAADPASAERVRAFQSILEAGAVRLDESLQEAEALLDQTVLEFQALLVAERNNGLVTRFLVENRTLVEEAFQRSLEEVLEEIHGSASEAWERAGRSYLLSGFFAEARDAFAEARRRGGEGLDLARLLAYAEGMHAYLERRYADAVEHLGRWLEAAPAAEEAALVGLAHSAVSSMGPLARRDGQRALADAAARLAERLQPFAPEPLAKAPAGG